LSRISNFSIATGKLISSSVHELSYFVLPATPEIGDIIPLLQMGENTFKMTLVCGITTSMVWQEYLSQTETDPWG
jgi:hypothetical protein